MGQHKTNPVAIAAKNGKLPPKPKATMSKRERERLLYSECRRFFYERFIRATMQGKIDERREDKK